MNNVYTEDVIFVILNDLLLLRFSEQG